IDKGQVTISELKCKLTVNMVEAILFDSGKAEVKQEGLVVLGKVIEILKTVTDKSIRIEGHTDNKPIVGPLTQRYPTNWELSASRAINVARYLQTQGIEPAALSAAAFGEFKSVADNATLEGRAKNRRIDRDSGVIVTVAGSGRQGYSGDGGPATEATLDNLYSLQVDTNGDIYIVDRLNAAIRKVDAATGIITTVAGTGEPGYGGDGG